MSGQTPKRIHPAIVVSIILLFFTLLLSFRILTGKGLFIRAKVILSPIMGRFITYSPTNELKYFYEPRANTVETVSRDWLEGNPIYTINSDSLNERSDYDKAKKKGTYRIVTLGDSFTFGSNVSTERNWTELLEDKLNKESLCEGISRYDVINLGVGGYDIAYSTERFKRRGAKYDPDLVIWFVTDIARITDRFQEMAITANKETWTKARTKLISEIGQDKILAYQFKHLNRFRKELYPGKLLFISNWEAVRKMGNSGIYYADGSAWNDKSGLLPDQHFNEKGHRRFMEGLVPELVKNKLLPCD